MAELVYTEIAGRGRDGPLVKLAGSAGTVLWNLLQRVVGRQSDPQLLLNYVNADLVAVLNDPVRVPEGTRIELNIMGLVNAGDLAVAVQNAYERGELIDPDTNEPVETWPEFQGLIAWGDNQSQTLTLRAVKNFGQIVLWLIITALGIGILVVTWLWLRQADWNVRIAEANPQLPPPPKDPAAGVINWARKSWPALAIGAGVLVAAPFVIGQVGAIRKAGRDFDEGGGG